ncbi:hypothetical protein ACWAUC_28585 [Bradyrhizobium guangdongense]
MQKSYLLAAAAALALVMQTPLALAQTAPAASGTPPAAATTAPAASTDNPAPPAEPKKSAQKKPKKKMTRRQEIDHSIDTGTVPARYRSSVPKQYQQYIPFEKQ